MECQFCHFENMPGASLCEGCHQSLVSQERNQTTRFQKAILNDAIRKLKPEEPIVVAPGTSIADSMQTMRDAGTGYVVVVEGESLRGIFTERDVLSRVYDAVDAQPKTTVDSVMTTDPDCLHLDDAISLAFHKMSVGGFRHVPILDDINRDILVGVVTEKDLLHYFEDYAKS